MERKIEQMKELVQILNQANRAYYQDAVEMMSNLEYDKLYDELLELENETGTILSASPTISVGHDVVSELPKERHESPMLSLDKTKERGRLMEFVGERKALVSWKLDGLTVVLTYRDGELQKAVTRGNGEVGEVITGNAKAFQNIPLKISYTGELVLRGEAIITYSDFARINEKIPEADAKYKNPRNLCSGSVRQLDSSITKERNVKFIAFSLVKADGVDFSNSHKNQFEWLKTQGFQVVEYQLADKKNLDGILDEFAGNIEKNDFPSDGLVLLYDDIAYGESLGRTSKFPRNAFAFKWKDERKETILREIEWSPSRTGLINPVAIFDPVDLEGTTVSRASVHNLSMLEELELGIGDEIQVYKANMIIPQIAENLTRSSQLEIPTSCPVCGGATKILQEKEAKTLYCTNPDCQAKHVKAFTLFVGRDALNIEGLSEATLEKFIRIGFVKTFADLFHLNEHRETIIQMEGFGEKSMENLLEGIEKSRYTTLPKLIYALGIPGIGLANAKLICEAYEYREEEILHAKVEELKEIYGIGEVMAETFSKYFQEEKHREAYKALRKELYIEEQVRQKEKTLEGKTFVITGSVLHFENRGQIKEKIESLGGKVTGSVSKNTTYLINNDKESASSKNKKAKELGISIISEEDFLKMVEE